MNIDLSLTKAISKEITHTTLDMAIDYSKMGFDEIINNDILKEIPIIKTIASITRISINIREIFFVKKLLTFLKEFHSQEIDEDKLHKFKIQFDTDEKYRIKVTEQIMIYNDAFLIVEKSKILAKLFRAHIEGTFDWDYFNYLSICLSNAHPKAFVYLNKLSKNEFVLPEAPDKREELGLKRDNESEVLLSACGLGHSFSSWSSGFKISQLGKDMFEYGMK